MLTATGGVAVCNLAKCICIGIFAALPAQARSLYPSDHLGLFFDLDAAVYCEAAHSFQTIDVYLLYLNPTVTEIAGYEVGIEIPDDFFLISASTPCGEQTGSLGQVVVECEEPIPCDPITLLLNLRVLYLGGGDCPLYLLLGAAEVPSRPVDGPFAVLQDGSSLALSFDRWAAFLDTGCCRCFGLPTERTTWGSIKTLYH
jgi:hypothetical protein